jgi:hypothetical protein
MSVGMTTPTKKAHGASDALSILGTQEETRGVKVLKVV